MTITNEQPLELFDPSVQWVDLAQHVARMWEHYVAAVARHSPTNVYPDRFAGVDRIIDLWRGTDPIPGRI